MADEKKDDNGSQARPEKPGFLENKVVMLGLRRGVQAVLAIGLTQFVILPRLGVQPGRRGESSRPARDAVEMGVLVSLEEIIVTLDADGPASPVTCAST